jgi:hypothetical protein
MNTRQSERPWHAIDVAELKYGLAFGFSIEELADFLHRDVFDVQPQIEFRARGSHPRSHCDRVRSKLGRTALPGFRRLQDTLGEHWAGDMGLTCWQS